VVLTGNITPVPSTPEYIAGLSIIRGEIISLVDLRILLSIPRTGLTDLNRVIVLSDSHLTFGILADQITGIAFVSEDRIACVPQDDPLAQTPIIQGIADESLILLNAETLLADSRMIIDQS